MSADSDAAMPKDWKLDPIRFLVANRLAVIDARLDEILAKVVAVMQQVRDPHNALESIYESYDWLLTERAKVVKRLEALKPGKADPALQREGAFDMAKVEESLAATSDGPLPEVVE